MTIYVLKLEKCKYYVGRTNDIERRYREHLQGRGSCWTMKYKPLEIKSLYKKNDPFYEDMLVKKYMNKYGIENVRGGSYSQINLTNDQINSITRELNGAKDNCFKCGGDHFVKFCKNHEIDTLPPNFQTDTIRTTYYTKARKMMMLVFAKAKMQKNCL